MKAKEVTIGPWPGGINLVDRPDQIAEQQLAVCSNFDVDNVGELIPRRAFRYIDLTNADITVPKYIMGTVNLLEQYPRVVVGWKGTATHTFLVAFNRATYIAGTDPGENRPAYFEFSFAGDFKCLTQYGGFIWLVPANASTVALKFDSLLSDYTTTSVASMPWGDACFVLKDRMFVVRMSTSEIFFSKATDFSNWTAPDGGVIKVNPGDNRYISKVLVVNNQIVIFKADQTYILNFTNSPTGDGTLRLAAPDQGAYDAVLYKNEVYAVDGRSVYKYVNGYFQDIAQQLNLRDRTYSTPTRDARLHIIGEMLVLGMTADPLVGYAMNLNTGAWSTYKLDSAHAGILTADSLESYHPSDGPFLVMGNRQNLIHTVLFHRINNGAPDSSFAAEAFYPTYEFFTKIYDFGNSMSWKRLHSWMGSVRFPSATRIFGNLKHAINPTITNTIYTPNRVTVTNSRGDLVGPFTSFRFRTVQFGFTGKDIPPTTANRTATGPTIRYIKAFINDRADVSKSV